MGTAHEGAWQVARKRVAAHALVRDRAGRVLLVEPRYAPTWLLPGGAVEPDESPRAACARELFEELGAQLVIGRLLVLEWIGPRPDLTDGLMLVYDGGVLPAGTAPRLPSDELSDYRWVPLDDVGSLADAELTDRVGAAVEALERDAVLELEDGERPAPG